MNKMFLTAVTIIAISTSSPIATVFAADNPTYKDGLLTIPSIDTSEQVGKYLDVTFKPTVKGTWKLLNFKETNKEGGGVSVAPIDKVEVIATDSFPIQVFLKVVTADLPGCIQVQDNQRLSGNQFDVGINLIPIPANMACTMGFGALTKTIPLSVYGLKTGIYSYSVNGATGTFNLTADNKLAGDTSL